MTPREAKWSRDSLRRAGQLALMQRLGGSPGSRATLPPPQGHRGRGGGAFGFRSGGEVEQGLLEAGRAVGIDAAAGGLAGFAHHYAAADGTLGREAESFAVRTPGGDAGDLDRKSNRLNSR